MKKYELLYRDADNYKTSFTVETDKDLEVDDKLEYEELGFTQETFHRDVVKSPYNDAYDHNFVTVTAKL